MCGMAGQWLPAQTMRKWQDLAAPDDPNSWYSVTNMWPTLRGTYETADLSTGEAVTGPASTIGAIGYAFAYGVSSGAEQEYLVMAVSGTNRVYSWNGTTLTERLFTAHNGLPMFARFGNVALAASYNSAAATPSLYAASNFSSNFSTVADAPGYDIIAIQSNAVLLFELNGTGWAVSDTGDHTNWTTGESASGNVYGPPGGFTAGVAYGNDAYAFKPNSIHRFTYVGGTVKWQVQTAWVGHGVPYLATGNTFPTRDWVVATKHGIAFYGGNGAIFLFDGSSPPRRLNPLTTIPVETIVGVFTYDPSTDMLCIAPSQGSNEDGENAGGSSSLYYYYSFLADAWGQGFGSSTEIPPSAQSAASGVVRGDWLNRLESTSPKPTFWVALGDTTDDMYRNTAAYPAGSYCQVVSSKYGRPDGKTTFSRLIPLLRRRTDLGTDSAVAALELFREREDTTATTTRTSIAESSYRKWFDLGGGTNADNFARLYALWTNLDIEVDDFLVQRIFVPDSK